VVTEICVFYRRRLEFQTPAGPMPAKKWLRHEWQRAGLPLGLANEVCGVRNAATRKYLTQDDLWYLPPPAMMARLVAYANRHGAVDGRPYFSLDGNRPLTATEWEQMRDRWTHQHGLTNVWSYPPLRGTERLREPSRQDSLHLNQKPLELMCRILTACTQPGDVIWEPFGGLCSATVAAIKTGRDGYAAEVLRAFYDRAAERLAAARQNGRDCEMPGRKDAGTG